jgi:hypothetical protein
VTALSPPCIKPYNAPLKGRFALIVVFEANAAQFFLKLQPSHFGAGLRTAKASAGFLEASLRNCLFTICADDGANQSFKCEQCRQP